MTDHDPTAFEIDFNPETRRMVGVALHGNTPFDVPFISHIEGNLYTGGCATGLVLPEHIEFVISLYPWERYTVRHEGVHRWEYRMYDSADGNGPSADDVTKAALQVCQALDKGPTLVHCQAGLNRSALIAATALWARGMNIGEAIDLLRERRSPAVLCNPAFEARLRQLPDEVPPRV